MRDYIIKKEDAETLDQVFSLDGLKSYFKDKSNHEFKISFQKKANKNANEYLWYEALIIALHNGYTQDGIVYIFTRCIEERKETEKNLNEYAHRLSYSLAMFEYAYSVNFKTEEVELIGGLSLDGSIFNEESVSYSQLTLQVKNSVIAEENHSAFRRFTYLDELLDYFSHNPPIITKYFKAADDHQNLVEVTVIYGARESKITIFVRKLNKNLMDDGTSDTTN